MRTAIISDIHGNYPALMKVLEDARTEHVDNYIFLGDYCTYDFPWPNEVAQKLMKIENSYSIRGNKERILKELREAPDEIINHRNASLYFSPKELTQDAYEYLYGLEDEMYIRLGTNTLVYAKHYLPISADLANDGRHLPNKFSNPYFYREAMMEKPFTHEENLIEYHNYINSDICLSYIQSVDANIIMYAHNHLQMYAYCGDKLIINPGSVGQPTDCNNKAAYTILEVTSSGFNVIEKRVAYDIEAVIAYTRTSKLYKKARIITELNIHDLRAGSLNDHILTDIIREVSAKKNEEYVGLWRCSDSTWVEAGELFIAKYGG